MMRNGWEIGIPLEYNTSESEFASFGRDFEVRSNLVAVGLNIAL